LLAPQWLVAPFFSETDFLEQSNASLRVVGAAMLIVIPAQMWFTAVVGTGDTAAALGIEFVLTLVMLGLTYLAAIHLAWPIALVWLSLPITWLVCLTVSYSWMKSGIWRRLKI
jgi:multidrug resistance protein, MATE family